MKLRDFFVLAGIVMLAAVLTGCGQQTPTDPRPDPSVVEMIRTSLAQGPEESEEVEESVSEVAGYGTLMGTFRYSGDIPVPPPINITKDQAVCGQHDLVDESLRVDPNTQGIADVVLFLTVERGQKAPVPHESYAETADQSVTLNNVNCRYEPHVLALRTSQTLIVTNKDSIGHNTKIDTVKNVPINPIIPANDQITAQFPEEERLPVKASCSIHPWMSGYVLIKETPYMAVTNEQGEFRIENLPAGDWEFQVWQEKAGPISQATVNGQPVSWSKGRMKVSIGVDSVTELDIVLDSEVF